MVGVEILEFVLTANHGSTLGYESVDGKINLIIEKIRKENESEYKCKCYETSIRYYEIFLKIINIC